MNTEGLEPVRLIDDIQQTSATAHFDGIAHVMRVLKSLDAIAEARDWDYLMKRLIAEGKRVARAKT